MRVVSLTFLALVGLLASPLAMAAPPPRSCVYEVTFALGDCPVEVGAIVCEPCPFGASSGLRCMASPTFCYLDACKLRLELVRGRCTKCPTGSAPFPPALCFP